MKPLDASVFVSEHCPNCVAMLAILVDLVKSGRIGSLEIVNAGAHPELATQRGIRSVPWLALGEFELTGLRTRTEIESWIERAEGGGGQDDYFHTLLKEGELAKVLTQVLADPHRLNALLPIIANPDASINVRIGAGAVFEEMAGSDSLKALVGPLGELTRHDDARVRVDACHYLGLTQAPAARAYLRTRLADADADVREVAADSLETLSQIADL